MRVLLALALVVAVAYGMGNGGGKGGGNGNQGGGTGDLDKFTFVEPDQPPASSWHIQLTSRTYDEGNDRTTFAYTVTDDDLGGDCSGSTDPIDCGISHFVITRDGECVLHRDDWDSSTNDPLDDDFAEYGKDGSLSFTDPETGEKTNWYGWKAENYATNSGSIDNESHSVELTLAGDIPKGNIIVVFKGGPYWTYKVVEGPAIHNGDVENCPIDPEVPPEEPIEVCDEVTLEYTPTECSTGSPCVTYESPVEQALDDTCICLSFDCPDENGP